MFTEQIVDYLVVGAGATGMAFADTLVSETDATVAIVDRADTPGGHWVFSYPFVRLHGSSTIYGVNSRSMPSDERDADAQLASRHEILDYYNRVMHEVLLPSGRVTYLSKHNLDGVNEGSPAVAEARSLITGNRVRITVRKRIVDAAHMDITVPAMKRPSFEVADGASVSPVNELPYLIEPPERFAIIGAGKTGLDACLWLLDQGVAPELITWIAPRDAWMVKRLRPNPGADISPLFVMSDCDTVDGVIDALESLGLVMRLDPLSRPTAFRCATVNDAELPALRKIEDVVRLGRVRRVTTDGVELEHGSVQLPKGTRYIDCSADGLTQKPLSLVFTPGRITLQPLLPCLLPVSAAVAAKLESQDMEDDERNRLCPPVQNPRSARDIADFFRIRMDRTLAWSTSPRLGDWLIDSRLGAGLNELPHGKDPAVRPELERLRSQLVKVLDQA